MAYEWIRWLDDVLTAAGVPVVHEGDWQHRGRPGGSFTPRGIMLHHDASPKGETSNGADVIINGREDLEGPLAQVWLDYEGRWHLCAAGRANHAGSGQWGDCPTDQGNTYFIGIETDHTTNEQWTRAQGQWGILGMIAICEKLGIRDDATELKKWLCAHKEYAEGRKPDPDPLDMNRLREVILTYQPGAPVKTHQKWTSTDRTLVDEEWRDLRFTDDEDDDTGIYAVFRGPASWFNLTVQVSAQGAPGTRFYLQPYKGNSDDEDLDAYNMRDFVIGPDGKAYVELTQQGAADDRWVRVRGKTPGGVNTSVSLILTRVQSSIW